MIKRGKPVQIGKWATKIETKENRISLISFSVHFLTYTNLFDYIVHVYTVYSHSTCQCLWTTKHCNRFGIFLFSFIIKICHLFSIGSFLIGLSTELLLIGVYFGWKIQVIWDKDIYISNILPGLVFKEPEVSQMLGIIIYGFSLQTLKLSGVM